MTVGRSDEAGATPLGAHVAAASAPAEPPGPSMGSSARGDGRHGFAGSVASGVRLSVAHQVFEQVVRLGLMVVLARLIDPADFGLMSMAFVITYLAILLSDLGVGAALIQRPEIERRHIDTAFTASSTFGLLLTCASAAGAEVIGAFFREPRLPPVIAVLSLTFLFKGVQGAPRDLLRRHMLFVPYTFSAGGALLVGAVVGVVVAVLGHGVWALVAYSIVESALGMVFSLAAAIRSGVWRPGFGFDRAAAKDLAGFTGYMMGVSVLAYGQSTADNLLVGRFLGASALGFYGLAYRIMLYPIQKVADVVGQVALPAFAAVQDDRETLRLAFARGQLAIATVCVPLSIGVVLVAPEAVRVGFGEEWSPAIDAIRILALASPFIAVVRLNGTVYQATGRPSWAFWMLVISTVLNVAGFAIGVQHGIEGVAIGFTVASALICLPHFALVSRALGVPARSLVGGLVPVVSATLAMVVAVTAARAGIGGFGDASRLAVLVPVGAAVYAAVLHLLAPTVLRTVVADVLRRPSR